MSENDAQGLRDLLRELIESTNKTMASHAKGLARHEQGLVTHEQDLVQALKSLQNHAQCIAVLRKDVEGLGALVNEQSRMLASMQSVLLKIVGMSADEQPPPTAPN
jgi:hypothetical protein